MRNQIHFIGIGGSGMSALAGWALAQGRAVSGSELGESLATRSLAEAGARIRIGLPQKGLPEAASEVIYTEAIDKASHPEYLEALERGLVPRSYFQALGRLSEQFMTIAVAGTHGKTTTTAMLGQALAEAGMDPTVVVGSRVPAFGGSNLRLGKSRWLVAEACEYRRSFLNLKPFGAIVLNCEPDHLDYYRDAQDYQMAFRQLAEKLPKEGFLVMSRSLPNAQELKAACQGRIIEVGDAEAEELGISLRVPGQFNRLNAAHAYHAGLAMGAQGERLKAGLAEFRGTARRMEVKGEKKGILVMDDYGHHPTEVGATLEALRQAYPERRLICVFQPHQYSRTRMLLQEFSRSFGDADLVLIPNIYESRDSQEDRLSISPQGLVEAISAQGTQALWSKGMEESARWLLAHAKSGDLVVTMGAGDVHRIGELFLEALS